MISNNVMSFMKKIVKSASNTGEDEGGKSNTINKLKQTVTLGMTVGRDKPKPFSKDLAYLTPEERSILQRVWQKEKEFETESLKFSRKNSQAPPPQLPSAVEKPPEPVAVVSVRSGESCRICRKMIEVNEQSHTCDECGQIVCEDCASYSKASSEQSQEWKCSFCRRRQGQDRLGLEPPPGSGMHRVPSVRRMAEKLAQRGSVSNKSEMLGLPAKQIAKEETCASPTDKVQPVANDGITRDCSHRKLCENSKEPSSSQKQVGPSNSRRKSISVANGKDTYESRIRRDRKSSSSHKERCSKERRGSQRARGSSSERRDQTRDKYCCSSETPSDRRSSSESQKGPVHPLPVLTSVRMNIPGAQLHSTHQHHSHSYSRESSPSESSLDEISHSPDYDKRRRYRVKRKSKIQRQKSYVEDPDSDPCGYRDDHATRSNATSSLESSSALESVENGLEYWPREYNAPSERPLRHISSDAVLYVGHFSSETSDESGEYSTSGKSGYSGCYKLAATNRQKRIPTNLRKRKDAKSTITLDSSPSDEEDGHNHKYPEKSCSLDEVERRQMSIPTQIHNSIPCVYIDVASDHKNSKRSQGFDYENWDFQRRSSTGRALPQIPDTHGFLQPSTRTQSTHSLDLPREDVGRPERRASAPERENIKIVIDDVDSEHKGCHGPQTYLRNVLIRRDPEDAGARTKGFGMRVMGGKSTEDGKLLAQISWIFPGGSAEKLGLKAGDKIMEWNGESLVNKTYEEVSAIMEKSGDVAELLVEVTGRTKSFDSITPGGLLKSKGTPKLIVATDGTIEPELSLLSPTRRKLPKTPDESCQHSLNHGEVSVQIWYDQDRSDLVVTVLSARGLKRRKSSSGAIPRSFAKVSLVPALGYNTMKTPLSEPSLNPEWSKTFIFPDLSSDDIVESVLEVTVWDQGQTGSNIFIGEAQIVLRRADLQDCPSWYPLTIPQNNALSLTHTPATPSIVPSTPAHDIARKMLRRGIEESNPSQSLNCEENHEETTTQENSSQMPRSSSMDLTLLHPNDAWDRHQTESAENSAKVQASVTSATNQGRRTPPNRRSSSSLVSQDSLPELYGSGPKVKERVRSASFRVYRSADSDTEKACESRKLGQIVKRKLSRTLSLKCDKDKRSSVVANTIALPEKWSNNISSPELTPDSDSADNKSPGQVIPKRLAGNSFKPKLGEIKLTFIMTKGQLEVDVVSARGLPMNSGHPPDTYVKTYLKDGEKQLQKKKTKVARHTTDPQYRQTLKYNASDVLGRTLLVMVWERQKGFEHNQAIGTAEIQLDKLELSKYTVGWYQLLPYSHSKAESTEST